MNTQIVFEHDDWLLTYKPPGSDFHDDGGQLGWFNEVQSDLNMTLYPVHRLDKPTSGLVLMAKSLDACRTINELFAGREMEKWYLALVPNTMKKKQGAIIGDMEKSRRGAFKLLPTKRNPAVTQFFSYSLEPGVRICLLKPKTGKTHQLRVALKSLAAPIIGDKLYGGVESDRVYLHAFALRFQYGGDFYEFSLPPTEGKYFQSQGFLEWLASHSAPWLLNWPILKK